MPKRFVASKDRKQDSARRVPPAPKQRTAAPAGRPGARKAEPAKAAHAKPEAFNLDKETRAWRDVWSAGHGVGAVRGVLPVAEVVAELRREYVG